MPLGLLGKKIGMTRIYTEEGDAIPVTVVEDRGNTVVQVKTADKDGYDAAQVGFDDQKPQRVNQPDTGHFKKAGAGVKKQLREFRAEEGEEIPEPGSEIGIDIFQEGQYIDVIGTTKGKGFQGVYKRYGFGGSPQSHGSMMHRRTGGIGGGATPGRVWKNTKMPGREGGRRRTVQNLQVVKVRAEDGVLLISGAVPGSKGGYVVIRPAKKKSAPEAKSQES